MRVRHGQHRQTLTLTLVQRQALPSQYLLRADDVVEDAGKARAALGQHNLQVVRVDVSITILVKVTDERSLKELGEWGGGGGVEWGGVRRGEVR